MTFFSKQTLYSSSTTWHITIMKDRNNITVLHLYFLISCYFLFFSGSSMAVVPLPLPANVKLQYATNMNLINSTKEFNRLKERCLELGNYYFKIFKRSQKTRQIKVY